MTFTDPITGLTLGANPSDQIQFNLLAFSFRNRIASDAAKGFSQGYSVTILDSSNVLHTMDVQDFFTLMDRYALDPDVGCYPIWLAYVRSMGATDAPIGQ